LCVDFIHTAIQTWNRIKHGSLTGINLLEESITDFNLLDLQIRHPQEIITRKFSKRKEAKEGADWEWWLGSKGSWLGLRVQAKILDSQKMRYPHLNRSTGYGRQIDLLINNALSHSYPKIPIYVFYNYWNINRFNPPWLCKTFPKIIEMLGCGISEAITVRSILNQGSDKLQDIANVMYPWSCLVCCKGFSSKNEILPLRAFYFIVGAFKSHTEKTEFPYERDKFVLEKAPSYVYKILERQKLTREELKEIKVNRVVIIYKRM